MSLSKLSVSLADQEKWQQFHPCTEMIVTKKRGRVIFPHLDYVIRGLERECLYTIHMHLERVDGLKYKFDQGEWKEAAKGDPILPIQYVEHANGARTGEHWMAENVSFSTLKITNNPKSATPKVVLVQSMHKYQPVLTIVKVGTMEKEEFRLELTEFIVVTAYQNEEIINLKVAHNKFASGFRSNGKRRNSAESENEPPKRRSPSDCSSSTSSSVSPPSLGPQMNFPMAPNAFYPQNPTAVSFPIMNSFGDYSTSNGNQFNNQYNNFNWNQYNAYYYQQNQQNVMNMNAWNMNAAPMGTPMTADPTNANANSFLNL